MYEEFDEAFGYRDEAFQLNITDTERPCLNEPSVQDNLTQATVGFFNEESGVDPHVNQFVLVEGCELPTNSQIETRTPNTGKKGIYSRTALSDLLEMQNKILEMNQQSKDKEVQLKESQLALERERFELEKEKLAEEKLQKTAQLQMERELRIMEMEVKKEIALKELEIKEKQIANMENKKKD